VAEVVPAAAIARVPLELLEQEVGREAVEGGGSATFSRKPRTRPEPSTSIVPNSRASSRRTGKAPTVTSAPLASWASISD